MRQGIPIGIWQQPLTSTPGTVYNYCAVLLQAILKKTTGKPLDELVKETLLFDPLGIADVEWVRFFNGDVLGHGGLRLRAGDLAKLGQLILNRHSWQVPGHLGVLDRNAAKSTERVFSSTVTDGGSVDR
jgi:CubicO group peptidase (beta-lactamase class C family)